MDTIKVTYLNSKIVVFRIVCDVLLEISISRTKIFLYKCLFFGFIVSFFLFLMCCVLKKLCFTYILTVPVQEVRAH